MQLSAKFDQSIQSISLTDHGRTHIVIIVQTQGSSNLRPTVATAAVCSNMEVLLLFVHCLLLLPLFVGGVLGPCFVFQYCVSF